MKKIYVYSKEEEEQINNELGYTQEQLDKVCKKNQYQFTLDLPAISAFFRYLFHKKCPNCNIKYERVKELKYVGLRHAPCATGGDYEKTYEVKHFRICPNCNKIY